MEIQIGDLVSVRHFSGTKLFKSLVLQSNGDVISVKPIEDITLLNCSKGDPIVLGCELDNNVYIASCTTLNMDKQQNTLELKIDNYETTSNKRLFVRFPVSLYAEARIGESHKKYLAIVKNISFTGMMIHSKDDFPLFQELKFEIRAAVTNTFKSNYSKKSKGYI